MILEETSDHFQEIKLFLGTQTFKLLSNDSFELFLTPSPLYILLYLLRAVHAPPQTGLLLLLSCHGIFNILNFLMFFRNFISTPDFSKKSAWRCPSLHHLSLLIDHRNGLDIPHRLPHYWYLSPKGLWRKWNHPIGAPPNWRVIVLWGIRIAWRHCRWQNSRMRIDKRRVVMSLRWVIRSLIDWMRIRGGCLR